MSDNDVRAAAERLRENKYDVRTENREEYSGTQLEADCETLARAYLAAEQPIRSPEVWDQMEQPITEEWFKSIGAKTKRYQGEDVLALSIPHQISGHSQWIETTPASFSHHSHFVIRRWSDLFDDGQPPDLIEICLKSRKRLLMLCSGLGMDCSKLAEQDWEIQRDQFLADRDEPREQLKLSRERIMEIRKMYDAAIDSANKWEWRCKDESGVWLATRDANQRLTEKIAELEQQLATVTAERENLRTALIGAAVEYDRVPYQLGDEGLDALIRIADRYVLDITAVQRISKGEMGTDWYAEAVSWIDEGRRLEAELAAANAEIERLKQEVKDWSKPPGGMIVR